MSTSFTCSGKRIGILGQKRSKSTVEYVGDHSHQHVEFSIQVGHKSIPSHRFIRGKESSEHALKIGTRYDVEWLVRIYDPF